LIVLKFSQSITTDASNMPDIFAPIESTYYNNSPGI
jgi:hypothetical protein